MEKDLPRLPSMASLAKIAEEIARQPPRTEERLPLTIDNVLKVIKEYQYPLIDHMHHFPCFNCGETMHFAYLDDSEYFDHICPVFFENTSMLYLFVPDKWCREKIMKHIKFVELLRDRIELDGVAAVVEVFPHKFFPTLNH